MFQPLALPAFSHNQVLCLIWWVDLTHSNNFNYLFMSKRMENRLHNRSILCLRGTENTQHQARVWLCVCSPTPSPATKAAPKHDISTCCGLATFLPNRSAVSCMTKSLDETPPSTLAGTERHSGRLDYKPGWNNIRGTHAHNVSP